MKHLTTLDMSGNQIVKFRIENLASLPSFGSAGRVVFNSTSGTFHYDTGTAWGEFGAAGSVSWGSLTGVPATFAPSAHSHAISDVTGLQGALDAKASSTHTHQVSDVTGLQGALDGKAASSHAHVAANISDFSSAVNAAIASYFTAATADTTRDSLAELISLITTNEGAIATLQAKADVFAVNAPSAAGTSATITHNLNTTDVIVQVREIATNALVLCDYVVTNANVVTLSFGASQSQDTLRVVVMG